MFQDTAPKIRKWDPRYDAEALHKSMKSVATYDKVLLEIFSTRSRKDLQEVNQRFLELYGKSLEVSIKTNCSGNYEKILVDLCEERIQLRCRYLRKAVMSVPRDEAVIIQILCSSCDEDLKRLAVCYRRLFGTDLASLIDPGANGDFKELMREILKGQRSSDEIVAERQVREDAQKLWFGEQAGSVGTNERLMIEILSHRSRAHIQRLFSYYEQKTGQSFEGSFKIERSEGFRRAATAIVLSHSEYHAILFREALKEGIINHGQLVRLTSTLSKSELEMTNKMFSRQYSQTLQQAIKSETSGAYQRILCALVPILT